GFGTNGSAAAGNVPLDRLRVRRKRSKSMTARATSHGRLRTVLEMIKFEHSVFALPFALTGALLAARFSTRGWPSGRQFLWIIVAMVAARSAAMTINRIADLRYDKANPRTAQRALATGALTVSFAWIFTLCAIAGFLLAAWQLNPLALRLAPVALFILFFYSFTKRFTNWSHLFLGFALPPRLGSPSPAISTCVC